MKKIIQISLTVILLGSLYTSCRKPLEDDTITPEYGNIVFKFIHLVDGLPLLTDTLIYVNEAGNQYQINELNYFISQVTLHRSDGTKKVISDWKDIDYVDISIPSTLTWNVYDSIPAGTYDSISFVFGITAEENQSFMFVNPPESNMAWPDILGGGYHYMMLNGKWKGSIDQVENLRFHMGIGQLYKSNAYDCVDSIYAFVQNYFTVGLSNSSFTIERNKTKQIEIIMNIDSWFKTPHTYDFNYWGSDIMQIQPAMQMAKENGYDVFTTGAIY